jgi:hypothetical protein
LESPPFRAEEDVKSHSLKRSTSVILLGDGKILDKPELQMEISEVAPA